MVGDQDGLAHREALGDAPGGVGEHDRRAPGGVGGPHRVGDGAGGVALVAVHPPDEGEDPPAAGSGDRADAARMAGDRRRREARQVGAGHLGHGLAHQVDRRLPPRAQHDRHVVAVDPGGGGQGAGGVGGQRRTGRAVEPAGSGTCSATCSRTDATRHGARRPAPPPRADRPARSVTSRPLVVTERLRGCHRSERQRTHSLDGVGNMTRVRGWPSQVIRSTTGERTDDAETQVQGPRGTAGVCRRRRRMRR